MLDVCSQDPILLDAFLQAPHLQIVPYLKWMVFKVPQPFNLNLNYHFLRFSSKEPLYVTVHHITPLRLILYIQFQGRQKPAQTGLHIIIQSERASILTMDSIS